MSDKSEKLSNKALELLTNWEGMRTYLYLDSAGLPTIGVGHLLTKSELSSGKIVIGGEPVKYADGITNALAHRLLAQDVEPAENAVAVAVKVDLTQNEFDALVSFVFNVGRGAFFSSTLLKEINKGNKAAVPAQLARWIHAGGRVVQGLVNRRQNEIKLWKGDL